MGLLLSNLSRRKIVERRVDIIFEKLFHLSYGNIRHLVTDCVIDSVENVLSTNDLTLPESLIRYLDPEAKNGELFAYNHLFDIQDLINQRRTLCEEDVMNWMSVTHPKYLANFWIDYILIRFAERKGIKWKGSTKVDLVQSLSFQSYIKEDIYRTRAEWLSPFVRLVTIDNDQYYINELAYEIYSVINNHVHIPEIRNVLRVSLNKSNTVLENYVSK